MSGTSLDAIDAAVADIDLHGDTLTLRPLGLLSTPYEPDLRSAIAGAQTVFDVCRLDALIGQAFAELAARAQEELGPLELIASHGQTLYHWVQDGTVRGTLQVGHPAWIAERTGLPVVADLRVRDVAAGGQGAPLVSLLDALLLRPGQAALNLGGIANLTIGEIAFDTGPANALLDAAAAALTGRPFDEDGALAARGQVIPDLLERLLADPYYARRPPKTTGKEHFSLAYLGDLAPYAPEDVLATLTRLTATTIADQAHGASELIASGGGVRNRTLMRELDVRIPVTTSDALGLPAQAKEAYAFALLGWLSFHGLPGTLPSATGARHASVLGSFTPARARGSAPAALRILV
jgi:anhydro-N-acetylmuramic acid kinase